MAYIVPRSGRDSSRPELGLFVVIRIYPYIIINLPLNQKIKTQNRYKPTNLENNYKNSLNQKPARHTNRPAKVREYDNGRFLGFAKIYISRKYLAGILFEIKNATTLMQNATNM
jgi:hypothetical protein